ncbi:MAG: hypothetical protein ACO1N0_21195 [Fluviicola sp.]
MRILHLIVLILLCDSSFAQGKEQPLKNLFNEFHASVNHGILNERTFFGGGLGVSHVFRPDKIFAVRTGLDFQFFHAWSDQGEHPSHYSSTRNIHYSYVDLTIPLIMRFNIRWVFIELGGNLGVGIAGQRRATTTNYSGFQQPSVTTTSHDSWNPGVSAGLFLGIGARIPLNEKLDLLIRPDVGSCMAFNQEFGNLYARLCIGIHLK